MARFEVIAKSTVNVNRMDVEFDLVINDDKISTFTDLVSYLNRRVYKYLDQKYLYDKLVIVFAKIEKELREKINKEIIISVNQMYIFVRDNRKVTVNTVIEVFNKHMETMLSTLYKENLNNKPQPSVINETRHKLKVEG